MILAWKPFLTEITVEEDAQMLGLHVLLQHGGSGGVVITFTARKKSASALVHSDPVVAQLLLRGRPEVAVFTFHTVLMLPMQFSHVFPKHFFAFVSCGAFCTIVHSIFM